MVLDLNPIAFHIGPIAVRWYGLFMGISILIGAYYFYTEAQRQGLDEDFVLNTIILAVLGGVVGARLMFVVANDPQWFWQDPAQILKVWEGGLAWHGALLGGLALGGGYVLYRGQGINRLADFSVPGLAIGYALVRVGNIFNQEVLGRPMALGWGFDRWPAQVVGSAIGLILLARYFYLRAKNPPPGYQFWSFIFYHQLLRGLVEETIRENPLVVWGYVNVKWGVGFFTLAQIATPLVMILAYVLMRYSLRRGRLDSFNSWQHY